MELYFTKTLWERDPGTGPPSGPPASWDPATPQALTGDIELDGSLRGHQRSLAINLTGEVGAMVTGSQGEVEHRGAEGLGVQRVNSGSCPGEGERSSPFAGPWQAAGQLSGAATLQRLQKVDVGLLCQG